MNKEESERWDQAILAQHQAKRREERNRGYDMQSPVPNAAARGGQVFQRDTAQTDTDDTRRSMPKRSIYDPYEDDSNEVEPTTEELIEALTEAVSQLATNVLVVSAKVDSTYTLIDSIIQALNNGYYPSPYEKGVMLKTVERSPEGLYTHEQVVEAIEEAMDQIRSNFNRKA